MSKLSYISPDGLRVDGRRSNEIRRLNIKMGVSNRADGSAYYEQGNTKILVTVYGPRESVNSKSLYDRAVVKCEFSMSSFSTTERKQRQKGTDRQATEIQNLIKQAFESTVHVQLYPRSQIDIFVQVLQSDGGLKSASINACTLALIDAGISMKDFVCACNTSCIDGIPVLDLNNIEERSGGPDLLLSINPQLGGVISLNMDSKVQQDLFESVLDLGVKGCQKIFTILSDQVKRYSTELMSNQQQLQQS
ncbi:Exosome complex exonuclease rrp41 [Tieghemostelium lacteum]|uniref:Exosome complex exonuclease rrp41 n=1 Tax=Tieghemostelium lacteum TaxID=361077 RepID=A0A151ZSN7_TIELA|nr:Exosome complex exonuclease rrp41 [Tieghemostelium lacteum]|eukprot:KYQ96926.1 Exosome complex exonuclease rrp41 [Tieghemostelium lacteum]